MTGRCGEAAADRDSRRGPDRRLPRQIPQARLCHRSPPASRRGARSWAAGCRIRTGARLAIASAHAPTGPRPVARARGPVRSPELGQQHRVGHADRSLRGLKSGLQHVGVGQVAACGGEWSLGSQGEAAALLGVENRAERARGVEIWQAQPVQRPVARHQGHRAPVANRCVVAKRDIAGVAHAASVAPEGPLTRCVVSSPDVPGPATAQSDRRARGGASLSGNDSGTA